MLLRLSAMPVAFLGVGVYRAWIATFFRFGAYPGMALEDYALFETCRCGRTAAAWQSPAFP